MRFWCMRRGFWRWTRYMWHDEKRLQEETEQSGEAGEAVRQTDDGKEKTGVKPAN